jgi:DNA repair protein RecN (Recombination protein N)
MIKSLVITNIAVVAAVELELQDGFTVLTGETGAGKSILVDALGLVLGDRGSTDLVRTGEERAVVEAALEVSRVGRFSRSMGCRAMATRSWCVARC